MVLNLLNLSGTIRKEKMTNVKCVLIGDSNVGKTCLLMSYTSNSFPQEYIPTVFDQMNVTIQWNEKEVSLGL
jgi:small GTP-binding protein